MEITNNLLAALVAVAMVATIASTATMMSLLPDGRAPFTGFANLAQSGIATVDLASEVAIQLVVQTVDFNDLAVTIGNFNDTTDYDPHPFVIRNNGTYVANISIAESTGDTLWLQDNVDETAFAFNATPNGSNGAVTYATWTDFSAANLAENASASDIYTNPANLIYNLSTLSASNERDANVHLNITIPTGESSGPKSGTIFFYAAAG